GAGDAVVRRERRGEATGIGGPVEILAYGGVVPAGAAGWPAPPRGGLAPRGPPGGAAGRRRARALARPLARARPGLALRMLLRRRWLEAGEVTLLLVLAVVTPPIVAFGLYFGLWHSVRQTTRLFVEAGRTGSAPDDPPGPAIGPADLLRMMVYGLVG